MFFLKIVTVSIENDSVITIFLIGKVFPSQNRIFVKVEENAGLHKYTKVWGAYLKW